ncbi:CPBP family intramembrane glutamic endopeptidase [Acetivibrio cellulolyticus]|uniref:CPBP family intramembrane glutamic endopeptidase n=1 Tax=Acetivibrio cellulolyticus TaxID=35830 RepID=UPI0038996A4E
MESKYNASSPFWNPSLCKKYLDKGIGVALLITCYQTVIGYFFGKLYLKTKSLTPGILIHLLWDIL